MKQNSRIAVALLVLAASSLTALGLMRVYHQHKIVRLGYELSEARQAFHSLEEEQNRLRVEESVLTNPGRIENLATALGMIRPTPDQLRIIKPNSVASLQK